MAKNASYFMVRTKLNIISGPIPKEELIHRVLHGELDTLDEVCPASGYWIFLHEREEVKEILGVDPPLKPKSKDGEDTETETETATATALLSPPTQSTPGGPATLITPSPLPPGAVDPEATDPYAVERPIAFKIFLYILTGILVFVLMRIFGLAQE